MVDSYKVKSARGTRSQRQYAAALDIDTATLSRWERGEAQPSLDSLAKMANEAGKPIEWFLIEVKRP